MLEEKHKEWKNVCFRYTHAIACDATTSDLVCVRFSNSKYFDDVELQTVYIGHKNQHTNTFTIPLKKGENERKSYLYRKNW